MSGVKHKHVYVTKTTGSFNMLDPAARQVMYEFFFPEFLKDEVKALQIETAFYIPEDKDQLDGECTALEAAEYLLDLFRWYWISSCDGHLEALVDYLQEIEPEQELLRKQYKIETIKNKIKRLTDELKELEQ